jgi:hypothetical protein|tara:strand:+ start:304 stop:678 length:375 start_codon:yes stop_codon:yes gene_type:complete
MALTKVAPIFDITQDVFFIGSTITLIEITYPAAVDAKTGPNSTIAEVHELIQAKGFNILGIGALTDTNTVQAIMIEGEYSTESYEGGAEYTFTDYLEDKIQALGTVDGINLATATVAAKSFAFA